MKEEKTKLIFKICNEKIEEQKTREKTSGYGNDDYSDGRIVGGASLARKIINILKN